jgi:hypothetical protein
MERWFPALALLLYFGGHVLRCARLYILSLGARRGGARLVAAHCLTAWASAVIPFKLGELLRIAGFGAAVRSPLNGAAIWMVERLSDAVALIVLILTMAWFTPVQGPGAIALAISIGFIIVFAGGAWMLTELTPFLRDDLLYRSRSPKGLWLLRVVNSIERAMAEAKVLLVGRFSATLLTALVIWTCEFAALALWAGALNATLDPFSSDQDAFAQRLPAFGALTLIGLTMAIVIFARARRYA